MNIERHYYVLKNTLGMCETVPKALVSIKHNIFVFVNHREVMKHVLDYEAIDKARGGCSYCKEADILPGEITDCTCSEHSKITHEDNDSFNG